MRRLYTKKKHSSRIWMSYSSNMFLMCFTLRIVYVVEFKKKYIYGWRWRKRCFEYKFCAEVAEWFLFESFLNWFWIRTKNCIYYSVNRYFSPRRLWVLLSRSFMKIELCCCCCGFYYIVASAWALYILSNWWCIRKDVLWFRWEVAPRRMGN